MQKDQQIMLQQCILHCNSKEIGNANYSKGRINSSVSSLPAAVSQAFSQIVTRGAGDYLEQEGLETAARRGKLQKQTSLRAQMEKPSICASTDQDFTLYVQVSSGLHHSMSLC